MQNDPGHRFRIFGMRRSGNHAVIDWLRRNIGEPSLFINDCLAGDPLDSFQYIELNERKYGTPFRNRGNRAEKLKKNREDWKHHVVSYEDQPPNLKKLHKLTQGYQRETDWKNVIVYRSFPNWLASFYNLLMVEEFDTKRGVSGPMAIVPFVQLYKNMSYVAASAPTKFVMIDFDLWVSDQTYRARLLQELEIEEIDNSTGKQSEYGGGSSFKHSVGTSVETGLTERWKSLSGEPAFRAIAELARYDISFCNNVSKLYPDIESQLDKIIALSEST